MAETTWGKKLNSLFLAEKIKLLDNVETAHPGLTKEKIREEMCVSTRMVERIVTNEKKAEQAPAACPCLVKTKDRRI